MARIAKGLGVHLADRLGVPELRLEAIGGAKGPLFSLRVCTFVRKDNTGGLPYAIHPIGLKDA